MAIFLILGCNDIQLSIVRTPSIYGATIDDSWVAYFDQANPFVLKSSTIIVVDCVTGEIRYVGSANDEN